MADQTKISFKLGSLEFSGEGKEVWLEKQLDKLLKQPVVVAAKPLVADHEKAPGGKGSSLSATLAAFLGEKNAKTNQNRKFLATAAYLQLKGKKPLKTADISAALKAANQGRLGNPSDTLNQNVSKGFCERDAGGFFVTEDGYGELGVQV